MLALGVAVAGIWMGARAEMRGRVGELALSGEVRRVKGVLPVALCAREHGIRVLGGCCGTDERHILSLALGVAG